MDYSYGDKEITWVQTFSFTLIVAYLNDYRLDILDTYFVQYRYIIKYTAVVYNIMLK